MGDSAVDPAVYHCLQQRRDVQVPLEMQGRLYQSTSEPQGTLGGAYRCRFDEMWNTASLYQVVDKVKWFQRYVMHCTEAEIGAGGSRITVNGDSFLHDIISGGKFHNLGHLFGHLHRQNLAAENSRVSDMSSLTDSNEEDAEPMATENNQNLWTGNGNDMSNPKSSN